MQGWVICDGAPACALDVKPRRLHQEATESVTGAVLVRKLASVFDEGDEGGGAAGE